MIERIDLSDNAQSLPVLALQLKCSKIEAELSGIHEFPVVMESMKSLQESGEDFYALRRGSALAGAISCRRHGKTITVCRLMVEPCFFRQGIASRLLRFVESQDKEWKAVKVSTGTLNVPAITLYKKHGFVEDGITEIAEGISLVSFVKRKDAILGVGDR